MTIIEQVEVLLTELGLLTVKSAFTNDIEIISSKDEIDSVQRMEVNRFFNIYLLALPTTTTEQRYCLIPNGEFSAWKKIFSAKIYPLLAQYE